MAYQGSDGRRLTSRVLQQNYELQWRESGGMWHSYGDRPHFWRWRAVRLAAKLVRNQRYAAEWRVRNVLTGETVLQVTREHPQ